MKVLFIHIYYTNNANGASTVVFSLIDLLRKNGNEPYLFATSNQPYKDVNYPYIKFFPNNTNTNGKFKIIDYIKNLILCIYNNEARKKIELMIDEINPDIVHIHTIGNLSFSIVNPIKKRFIPIIYTLHDARYFCPCLFTIGLKYCTDCKSFNVLPCILKKCSSNNFFRSLYIAFKTIIIRLICPLKDIDVITVPSISMKNYLLKFNVSEKKLKLLENFVNDNFMHNAPSFVNKGYFLYAGGLYKQKGIYTLLEAMKTLPKDIELHIAGEISNKKEQTKINKILQKSNLLNVKVLGKLEIEKLKEQYKNCISVIMPSELFESFGMINIECATYGKPSISSNIGGLSDFVENNKNGLLFEPANVEQLKECILKYWNNPELVIEHGKNAYHKAITQYTEENYYKKLIKLYEEVIDEYKLLHSL